jgi:hypothetical protein
VPEYLAAFERRTVRVAGGVALNFGGAARAVL